MAIDGRKVVTGAVEAAFVFDLDGFSEPLELTTSDDVPGDRFGWSAAADDGVAIIGAIGP